MRLVVQKLTDVYGNYPGRSHVMHAASLIGRMLGMPSEIFYDPKSYDGFIPRCLQNCRRKLEGYLLNDGYIIYINVD